MLNPIVMRIEQVLVTMMTASIPYTPDLDALFNLLRGADDPSDRADAEQRIWEIWTNHEEADAASAMRDAIDLEIGSVDGLDLGHGGLVGGNRGQQPGA